MNTMQDWNAYRETLLARVGEFAKHSPDVLRGLNMVEGSGAKTKHLEPKIHELIALAVAVTTRCDGCIGFHAKAAIKAGATREEILETLSMAIYMGAGPSMIYASEALRAFDELSPPQEAQA